MVEDRIGYRYAKSAFALAEEREILEETQADMKIILDAYRESREFTSFLRSPIISSGKKQAVLRTLFADRFKGEMSGLLVDMIAKKGREMYLPQIATAFTALYDQKMGISRGTVTSAQPLSEANRERIIKTVEKQTGTTFELEEEVDPSLIGGFILKIGDTSFDGSIAASLRKIKQEFQKENYTVS